MAAEAKGPFTVQLRTQKKAATLKPHAQQLSPRQKRTLDLLLRGYSRQKIAENLHISPHTASGYVKEVFRHFGVHTHVELIAGFYHGKLK
jgi:DNA-binding CsgD family transcriptional regulator